MKPMIYVFGLLLFSVMVMGIPAGTVYEVYNFDRCDSLRVDVSGVLHINNSEYELLNCEETSVNSWFRDCNDNYVLKMNTSINTINNYSFTITHNYSVEREESNSGGSSGGGGGSYIESIDHGDSEQVFVYRNSERDFEYKNTRHSITFNGEQNNVYNFTVRSDPIDVLLRVGENKTIDLDDGKLNVKLVSASSTYYRLRLTDMPFSPAATTTTTTTTTTDPTDEIKDDPVEDDQNETVSKTVEIETTTTTTKSEVGKKTSNSLYMIARGLGILIFLFGIIWVYKRRRKKNG